MTVTKKNSSGSPEITSIFKTSKHYKLMATAVVALAAINPVILSHAAEGEDIVSGAVAIEEIMVTATKRSTKLQDTPMAITAMTMDQLDRAGVRSADDLASIVPGLNLGNSSGTTQISLRGVGNDSIFLTSDPTVAFHVDGVYRGRQTGGNAVFLDLERVEVLKGPQGTLYGRNATAGSMNVITQKPTDELEGYVDGVIGSYGRLGVRGAINVPIIEGKLALRAAFMREQRDGYFDNGDLVENNYADQDDTAFRLHALVTPTDNFSMLFTAEYQGRGGVGGSSQMIPDADGKVSDITDPYTLPLNSDGVRDDDFLTLKTEFNLDLDFATITYIGAYYESSVYIFGDFDRGIAKDDGIDVLVESAQQSHELRLASNTDGPFEWIVGGFYFDENSNRSLNIDIAIPAGTIIINTVQPDFNVKSKAIFGQLSYNLSEDLKVTGGLRYSKDEKSEFGTVSRRETPFGNTVGTGNQVASWESVDWKIELDWHPSEDTLIYGKVSTGYKSGGFNSVLLDLDDLTFKPEEIMAFQVGQKSQFLDGKLQVNSEAFYYDYKDLQLNQIVDTINVVENASDAKIYGIDTEIIALPTDNMRLDLSMAYLHTEFSGLTSLDAVTGNTIVLNGEKLMKAPEFAMHVGLQYTFVIGDGYLLIPRVSFTYETETKLRIFNDLGAIQPSYTRTDVNITLESPDAIWSAQVFVTNIEDNPVWTNAGLNGANQRILTGRPPRMFGARLKYNFGG